ncbi:hypothetical protein [Yoonia sp. SS1-5]|uniref:Uncharacterized protein n=1 Tax=Yoonia rhodophyticola TaxID=3137370 RepID=A0AAN0MK47_9RHOB
MSQLRANVSASGAANSAELLEPPRNDRFLLTPALRVDPPESEPTPDVAGEGKVFVLEQPKRAELAGLEATIAELEAAVTAQPEDWEADEGEGFDQKDDWAESAFSSPAAEALDGYLVDEGFDKLVPPAEPDEDPTASADAPDNAAAAEPVAVAQVDPDMLRDMVAQIIREELSGEIGEKMTGSIRKLVRREINRILSARDIAE